MIDSELNHVNTVAGTSTNAIAIEIPEAYADNVYDLWDSQFCIYLKDNEGQVEGNDFSMSLDVYWESDDEADDAQIYFIFGRSFYNSEGEWIDYTWNSTDNTELISPDDFWSLQQKAVTVAKNEWTTVSWGDDITIGDKGENQIGIRIDLAATRLGAGQFRNNTGTFYFRNIEIKLGEDNVLSFFGLEENNGNYTLSYETNGSEATVTGIELLKENVSNVTIPSTVTIEGVEYTVTGIAGNAFANYIYFVNIPNNASSI